MTHDKDFPSTIFESSLYAGGEDAEYVKTLENHGASTLNQVIAPRKSNHVDGVFATNGLSVGAALCWELARYRTARRLHGKIDLLLGASAWWWSTPRYGWPDERTNDEIAKDRTEQIALIREAPRRLARMLGVPVVHANFVGDNPGFFTSDFANPVTGQYLGQSQIVNSNGETVALLQDQEGVAIGEVKPGRSEAKAKIPRDFWMPEMDARARRIWVNSGAAGRDFYVTQRRPKLRESR
jgi:predicted amidohydrolase